MPQGKMQDLPMQVREAAFVPATLDAEKRTIELVWSTGATVRRFDWWNGRPYDEELVVSDNAVDLTRLASGAPLLDTHGRYTVENVIGVVERAWIEGGEGKASVRFSDRDGVADIWRDVQAGIIRNVSVGYQVRKFEITEEEGKPPLYRAVDWQPYEISLVPVGADAGAGTRAGEQKSTPCEFVHRATAHSQENPMTDKTPAGGGSPANDQETTDTNERTAPATPPAAPPATTPLDADAIRAAERARVVEIRKIGNVAGMDATTIDKMVEDGVSADQARARAIEAMAARSDATPTRSGVQVLGDETDKVRELVANALLHRYDGAIKLEDGARQYRGMSLMEIGDDLLKRSGISAKGMSRGERADMILGNVRSGGLHTTSDFPFILANVAGKSLRRAYEAAPQTFKPFSRRTTLPDFKDVSRVQLGDAPRLLPVNEHGEFTRGTMAEGREQWRLGTFGRVFGVTRQVLINDDLDAFTRIPSLWGRAAADLESDTVWAIITDNAAMADTIALFHADHANLAAVSTAPAEASLGAARAAMRKQTSLSGNLINVEGRFILVPPELETVAQKQVAAVTPNSAADVNPFSNTYKVIAEPRLSANSVTAWYLAADPAQIDTIEFGYLQGQEGVYLESRIGFDVDGVEFKARLDFGAKAIDWRGLFKNAG